MSKLQGGDVLRIFAKQILNNSRCLKVFNKCKYIYIFRFCKCFGTFFYSPLIVYCVSFGAICGKPRI